MDDHISPINDDSITSSALTMGTNITTVLPSELLSIISDEIEAEDYLCWRLTCKAFQAAMHKKLATTIRSEYDAHYERVDRSGRFKRPEHIWSHLEHNSLDRRGRQISVLARTEMLIVSDAINAQNYGRLDEIALLCSICGKIKDRLEFDDGQSKPHGRMRKVRPGYLKRVRGDWTADGRQCIACVVKCHLSYPTLKEILIRGQTYTVCCCCKQLKVIHVCPKRKSWPCPRCR